MGDVKAWPERAILPGTRVRVVRDTSWDGPWEREFTGVLSPNVVPTLSGSPRGPKGELEYLVIFDDPQMDCDGCGPYVKAMIRSRYIRVEMRGGWVGPAAAPRPVSANMRVVQADMAVQPGPLAPEPDVLYQVSLPGGMEADVYTDVTGQVRYVETVPGTAQVPNPVLDAAAAGATYVVHPASDGRFAVVLRFDEQARMVEVVADPLAPVGSYGTGGHRLTALLAGGIERVSSATLLELLGTSTVDGLGRLGIWLSDAVNRGQRVSIRLLVFYDGTSVVPASIQTDWSVDGQTASEALFNS